MQQLMGPISLINPLTITPIAAYTPTAFNQQVAYQRLSGRRFDSPHSANT